MLKKSGKIFHRQSPDLQQVFHRGEGRILAWLWGLRTFPQFQHPLLLLYSYNNSKCIGYITVKPLLWRTDSRFAKPRKVSKGFNFVCVKPPLRRAESRFGKPRSFPVRETDWYFLRRAKSTAKTRRGLRPSGLPGTIQISARYMIFAKVTGVHHVTGHAGYCKVSGYRR